MRKVTLTFDNGPDPVVTPQVLDCLKRHNIQATFFVMGRKVVESKNAAVAKQANAAGHWIGNHTFSHSTPLGELDAAAALREFDLTEQALEWLKQPVRLFRPYGRGGALGNHLLQPAVIEKLQAEGFTCVIWKSVSGDWKNPDAWMQKALADCRATPWSMVVLHDIPSGAMVHLDEFLKRLEDEGFEFTQAFPPDCTPIVRGELALPIEPYCSSGMRI